MIKFLAFLLILCILFGVEATRSLIFGTFGFIFWALIILAGIGLAVDLFKDKRTPEQKEADAKKKAEQAEKEKELAESWRASYRRIFWPIIITVAILGGLILLLIFTSK